MELLTFQIFAIITVFLIAFIAGLVPIQFMKKHETALALGDAWASGIFLGAAFFHMLPDATNGFYALYPNNGYPLASLFCIIGFLLLLIIERLILQMTKLGNWNQFHVTGILLLIILSIHSLIEGGAIGINDVLGDAIAIFLAVIAHKGSASFALAMKLRYMNSSNKTIIAMLLIFSVMTPLGIIIAGILNNYLQTKTGKFIEASFNAFAAGSFLYIGARHLMEKQFTEYVHVNRMREFTAVILGIIVMAVLAIWI